MDIEQDWVESLTSGADGYANLTWEDLGIYEMTTPSECSCGGWKTYGKVYSPFYHSDWCDLNKKENKDD